MFYKIYQIMFIFTLMAGSLIAVSSNSWFTAWLGLEINLMSMIPLILVKLNKSLTESSIKYFMAQAMASMLLMAAAMVSHSMMKSPNLEIQEFIMLIALTMKAGIPPFHFWFPQITPLMGWSQCFILFTWQKVAPLILMMNLNINMIFYIASMAAIVGAMGGLNQTNLKIILTYSSISHTSWMIMSLYLSMKIWIVYISVYSTINLSLIMTAQEMSSECSINEMNKLPDSNQLKYLFAMNMLSLGGLPPLLGFVGKTIVAVLLMKSKVIFMVILLIFSSLVSIFFYARLIYSSLMMKNKMIFMKKIDLNSSNKLIMSLTVFLNILIPPILILT